MGAEGEGGACEDPGAVTKAREMPGAARGETAVGAAQPGHGLKLRIPQCGSGAEPTSQAGMSCALRTRGTSPTPAGIRGCHLLRSPGNTLSPK